MARFDPHAYPDRLAFEAHAHRIRAEAIDKAFAAMAAWLQTRQRSLRTRLGNLTAADGLHPHRHSTH